MSLLKNARKPFSWIMIGAWLLVPHVGWADDLDDRPQLRVSAEGKQNVPPDKAILAFGVETAGENLADVQRDNQDRMKRILKACQELHIPSNRIQTTALNVIPQYPPPPRRSAERSLENHVPRIIGYQVTHQVNVEVRDIEHVGKVVDRVLKAGANRFSGISWALQDEEPVKLKVLQTASLKAQAKAKALAQALHVKLVRVIQVNEGGVSVSPPIRSLRMARPAMAMMESGGDASVSAGEITIRGTVTLVYEIQTS